jgi:hypothetical protein
MTVPVQEPSRPDSDRYEPLPGIAGLPGWVWRRLPQAAKIGVSLLPLVAIGLVLLLGPGIDRSKDERRGAAAGFDVARRKELLAEARAGVEADALRRVAAGSLAGPVRRVTCEPFPRTLDAEGAHLDPDRAFGRYACLAVTHEVPAGERSEAATIGHPYRLRIDFTSGRYALCKVAGRAGEGAPARPLVTVPRVCGGP